MYVVVNNLHDYVLPRPSLPKELRIFTSVFSNLLETRL